MNWFGEYLCLGCVLLILIFIIRNSYNIDHRPPLSFINFIQRKKKGCPSTDHPFGTHHSAHPPSIPTVITYPGPAHSWRRAPPRQPTKSVHFYTAANESGRAPCLDNSVISSPPRLSIQAHIVLLSSHLASRRQPT